MTPTCPADIMVRLVIVDAEKKRLEFTNIHIQKFYSAVGIFENDGWRFLMVEK
jgi:hypothetical protein